MTRSGLIDRFNAGVFCVSETLEVLEWNMFMVTSTGKPAQDVIGKQLFDCFPDLPKQWLAWKIRTVFQLGTHAFSSWRQRPYVFRVPHNRPLTGGVDAMRQDLVFLPIKGEDDEVTSVCVVITDVTDAAIAHVALERAHAALRHEMEERQRLELELRLAHKLEAVGQLAAGIAHEMNTPLQFLNDNSDFLAETFADVMGLVERYRATIAGAAGRCEQLSQQELDELAAAEDRIDVPYLTTQVPATLERTRNGLERLSRLVRSMKEFHDPNGGQATEADINRGLEATLTIACSQFAPSVEITTELGELPRLECNVGELNQAFLSILANAADAITAANRTQGAIRVATRLEDGVVVVEIGDDGVGIAPEIRQRIFDPFFTTKEVGGGTGQGLHVARAIVNRHGGMITFDSEPGRGTTFYIRLPLDRARASAA
jgi:two-component system, NtrC family, sensor kinase